MLTNRKWSPRSIVLVASKFIECKGLNRRVPFFHSRSQSSQRSSWMFAVKDYTDWVNLVSQHGADAAVLSDRLVAIWGSVVARFYATFPVVEPALVRFHGNDSSEQVFYRAPRFFAGISGGCYRTELATRLRNNFDGIIASPRMIHGPLGSTAIFFSTRITRLNKIRNC